MYNKVENPNAWELFYLKSFIFVVIGLFPENYLHRLLEMFSNLLWWWWFESERDNRLNAKYKIK